MSHLRRARFDRVSALFEPGAKKQPDAKATDAALPPSADVVSLDAALTAKPARDTEVPYGEGKATVAEAPNPVAWPRFSEMPGWLARELRSDHAGEYGAVMIYRGILAVSRDSRVRQFAEHHLLTERQHLALMEEIIPRGGRTKLLRLWHLMGWLTGALPALVGPRAVFATIEAVERFVDQHYQQQIDQLEAHGGYGVLRQALLDCQADEVSHRDEAAQLASQHRGVMLRLWCAVVGAGSAVAVVAARRV